MMLFFILFWRFYAMKKRKNCPISIIENGNFIYERRMIFFLLFYFFKNSNAWYNFWEWNINTLLVS